MDAIDIEYEINRKPHETVTLTYGDKSVEIDTGIAPLIYEIWKAGLHTDNSCEEKKPGIIWISFISARYCELFLNIVATYESGVECLYNRIRWGWRYPYGVVCDDFWDYDVSPRDYAVEQVLLDDDSIEESFSEPNNFRFSLSVRFPKTDYPIILERMIAHNNKKKP